MIRVLFVCTGNSARSQMAEGLLRELGEGHFDVHSAGIDPRGMQPLAVRSMAEIGIDISAQESKNLDRYIGETWDYVITLCDHAAESCPVVPGAVRRLHWSFPDPAAAGDDESTRLRAFRSVRDVLVERIRGFQQRLDALS